MHCPIIGYWKYGKEDIKKDCKFCNKTDRKRSDVRYGYECIIKHEKRKMSRCCWCIFGHSNFGH